MRLAHRSRRDQAKTTDDWLITYADTITLLLCLFVIIMSARNTGKTVAAPPPVQPAASDFIFVRNSPFPARVCDPAPTAGIVNEVPVRIVADEPDPRAETPVPAVMAPPPPVPEAAAKPNPVPSSLPAMVDRLKSQGTAVVEQHGDRITTLQIGSAAVFSSGYAALSASGKSILGDVAISLKSPEFAAYHVSVEGHTDDAPINTVQFQSNWELSTARAASVVRFFLELGIPAEKLTAAGYADTFPIAPNRAADGTVIPENQAKNRRVVIRLEKIDKVER